MPFTKCPVCGYNEVTATNRERNEMNHYVNEKNPKEVIVINSSLDKVVHGTVTYIKQRHTSAPQMSPSVPAIGTPKASPSGASYPSVASTVKNPSNTPPSVNTPPVKSSAPTEQP